MAVEAREANRPAPVQPAPTVKCVVWDLDDTLWHGTLLENDDVRLRDGVVEIIRTLDGRGILHSIASRNDPDLALGQLRRLGLEEYFLAPRVGWSAKSEYVRQIADELNIGADTLLFVDDQAFERAEVASAHPAVRTADVAELPGLLARPDLNPRFVTDEARTRRLMYQGDLARRRAETAFTGPSVAFLASLGMELTLGRVGDGDLARAEELTRRTNQLNATGYTYSYEELAALSGSPRHTLIIAELTDRFGSYGKIGLSLVERGERAWAIKLLLASCRVMSRGVGSLMLREIVERSQAAGVVLWADFVPTPRNRMMSIAYSFAGFEEAGEAGGVVKLRHNGRAPAARPEYVRITVDF